MKRILETPRLILRELSLDDLDFMAALLSHPEVMRFYPKCYPREEAEAWIRRQMDRYAQQSHERSLVAQKNGFFAREIVPIETEKGTVSADDGPRPVRLPQGWLRLVDDPTPPAGAEILVSGG